MKSEKLEILFDSFIASKCEIDTVDAVLPKDPEPGLFIAECAAHFEDPLTFPSFNGAQNPLTGSTITGVYGGNVSAQEPSLAYAVQSTQASDVGRQLRYLATQFSSNLPDCSSVRFEKSCIIVAPENQTIPISVMRSGPSTEKIVKLTWKTEDKTAVKGMHYKSASGEIIFNQGETTKTIEIEILRSDEVDNEVDLRFKIEMSVVDEGFDPKPMIVSLKKLDSFYDDERQVIKNFPSSSPFTVADIKCALEDKLTTRTFHMALTHLCSGVDSVHMEFALALDLSQLCMRQLRRDCILKVLEDFFRMDDIDF